MQPGSPPDPGRTPLRLPDSDIPKDLNPSDNMDLEVLPASTRPAPRLLPGLVAATFTPLRGDGSMDIGAIPDVCEAVLEQGANGLFVCGSTGEGPSLTVDERRSAAEAYLISARGRVPVVVHVGSNCLADSRLLAAHAADLGASAIAVVPPSYFALPTVSSVVDVLSEVAEAAPELPLFYYHVPALTGVNIKVRELLAVVGAAVPSFAGVKYSAFDFDDLIRCVHAEDGKYEIVFGSDEMLLAGLATGARGAVGSTFNYLAPWFRKMISAFDAGRLEEARLHQLNATSIVHAILEFGGVPALKLAMGILVKDCGPVRAPLVNLAADLRPRMESAIRREMEAAEIRVEEFHAAQQGR